MRIRIDMDYDTYSKGDVLDVEDKVGHPLIGMGVASVLDHGRAPSDKPRKATRTPPKDPPLPEPTR